jgi:hypothetical protein
MSEQDRTEQELAEQRRADHLKHLAGPGSNYAYGYLNHLVGDFLDGSLSEQALREMYAELQADMEAAREGGVQ